MVSRYNRGIGSSRAKAKSALAQKNKAQKEAQVSGSKTGERGSLVVERVQKSGGLGMVGGRRGYTTENVRTGGMYYQGQYFEDLGEIEEAIARGDVTEDALQDAMLEDGSLYAETTLSSRGGKDRYGVSDSGVALYEKGLSIVKRLDKATSLLKQRRGNMMAQEAAKTANLGAFYDKRRALTSLIGGTGSEGSGVG